MSARLCRLIAALTLLAGAGGGARADDKVRYYVPDVPADMRLVDFYLITGGLGDEVANRFGHTGIRVLDRAGKMDVVFNWGKFSFSQAGFLWKFFRGSLTYSMGVRTFAADKQHFRDEARRQTMQTINLTLAQKRRLLEKIAWNAVPERRDFAYQYWFKNCATIPRDYLDEVLDGQVRARFAGMMTDKSFRDYMRRGLSAVPFVASGLDVLMNGNIDRKISAWEEMFLPEMLSARLSQMPAIDDDGNPVAGKTLLSAPVVLSDHRDSFARPFNDYLAVAALGLVPLLTAAGFAAVRRPSLARRALGLSALLWGVVAGALGTTLLANWVASGHPDGWANINLLLFWPLDFYLIPVGWALLRRGERVKDRVGFVHAGVSLALAHAAAFVALVALRAGGVVSQDVGRVVAYFGSVTVLLLLALARFGLAGAAASAKAEPGSAPDSADKGKLLA